ncbi:hypothetical protein DIPPA_08675 [Diplonema papillatum]|nr:hypothetical protein DIPPA_08675 [Diplonema papillatum]
MDKYQAAARARTVLRRRATHNDDWWTTLNPVPVLFGERVVWARDCRKFLTAVHATGYTEQRKSEAFARIAGAVRLALTMKAPVKVQKQSVSRLRATIPLTDIESVVRRYRPLDKRRDNIFLRAVGWVPVLRDAVLVRQGLLYSNASKEHHARIKSWCDDMRALADQAGTMGHSAKTKERPRQLTGGDLEAKAPGSASFAAGPTPEVAGALTDKVNPFDTVPQAVFIETLVGLSRHRNSLDQIKAGVLLLLALALLTVVLQGHADLVLATRCAVHLVMKRLMSGAPCTEADLAEYLRNLYCPCTPAERTAPKGIGQPLIEVVDGKIVARAVRLRNDKGATVTVAPLPRLGPDRVYWEVGALLRGCDAVGIELYHAKTPKAEFSLQLFFPVSWPAVPVLGLFDYFVPIFHGDPPHPDVFGLHQHYSVHPVFDEVCNNLWEQNRKSLAREAAASVAGRSMTFKHIGTAAHPGCSKALCEELAKRGFSHVEAVVPFEIFDGGKAAESLLSLFPNLRLLLSGAKRS